jgi:hypothetical protein
MPEKNQQFGKYGARGIKGSEAVAQQLDKLVTYISTPIGQARGLMARLKYLTGSPRRLDAARAAGLDVTPATLRKWQRGMQKPNKANLDRIDRAYRTVRRANVQRHLIARLNRDGRGTRVEIHPFNQSHVSRPRQRSVEFRTLNIRHWDAIVRAWAHGDASGLDDAWVDELHDLGSQWGQYEYVTNVGFAA